MNKYTEYLKHKIENPDKVVFVKIGNFYHTFDIDALIIESIFNYKLSINKEIKVGFPISSVEKIKAELDKLEINHFIVYNNDITKNDNNAFEAFKEKVKDRHEYIHKYKYILDKLNSYIFDKDSDKKIIDDIYETLK